MAEDPERNLSRRQYLGSLRREIIRRSQASISRSSTERLRTYLLGLDARRAVRLEEIGDAERRYYSRLRSDPIEDVVRELDADPSVAALDKNLLVNQALTVRELRRRRAERERPRPIEPGAIARFGSDYFSSITSDSRKRFAMDLDSEYDVLRGERLGTTYSEEYARQRRLNPDGKLSDALESIVDYYVSGDGDAKPDSEIETFDLTQRRFTRRESDNSVNRILLMRVMRRNRESWPRN